MKSSILNPFYFDGHGRGEKSEAGKRGTQINVNSRTVTTFTPRGTFGCSDAHTSEDGLEVLVIYYVLTSLRCFFYKSLGAIQIGKFNYVAQIIRSWMKMRNIPVLKEIKNV